MVPVVEGEDEEVAEPYLGISDIREGWVAPDLVTEADPLPKYAVEQPGVLAGVGGGLESSAEVSCLCVEGGWCSSCQPSGCH